MKKSIIRIIFVGFFILILLASIVILKFESPNIEEKNVDVNFDNKDIILYNKNDCDCIIDFSNIKNLVKESDIIARVKIQSVNGTNLNPLKNEYVPIYTTGKLEIEEILYNNSNYEFIRGESIEYVRLGGNITYSTYLEGLRESERKKLEYNIEQRTNMKSNQLAKKIVKDVYIDDIEVENGKEYIAFLKYSNDYEKFNILGFEYGLREYDSNTNTIKDNKSNKYESFQSIKEKISMVK